MIDETTALLRDLEKRLHVLEGVVSERDAQIAERDAQIAERDARIAALEAEVADLREQLGQDSSNSGRPPSSDSPAARQKRRTRRKKGSRKRGGQKGHKGHHRELVPPDKVDDFVDVYPTRCQSCGKDLPQQPHSEPERHQVVEVPPVRPKITEYRTYKTDCPCCGATNTAGLPAGVSYSPFGPRLVALVGLLTVAYRLSKRATARLLKDLLGIEMSVGALSANEQRLGAALSLPVEQAEEHVRRQPVKYSDATSWRQGDKRKQLWTIACALVSVFKVTADGTMETAKRLLGSTGTLISDRAGAFLFWVMKRRQVCWAHLLRTFTAFVDRGGSSAEVGTGLLEQAHKMFEWWHRVRDGTLSRVEFQAKLDPLKKAVRSLLTKGNSADHKKTCGSCGNILKYFDALWTFAQIEGVEPTNNHAEQQLRHLVIWRRTSFATQSDRGSRFIERMMTTIATLRKQRRDVWEYLTASYGAYLKREPPPSLLPAEPMDT